MRSALILAAALLLTLQPSPSPAQTADELYKSNDITLVVATDVGGGYDLYARALAPYLKRHIASHSNVIVQNMPGAGDIRMANYMAANAKTDGSVIGLTLSPVVLNQLTQPAKSATTPTSSSGSGRSTPRPMCCLSQRRKRRCDQSRMPGRRS